MTELAPAPRPSRSASPLQGALARRDPITKLPIVILFPHSRCNCRCLMCDIWRVTAREEIRASDLSSWLKEWKELGVERVMLSGGEPLMHSHIWDFCKLLHSAGIGITILSTGILLKRHASQLVRFCDDVVVSLDGPREVHNQIRNVRSAYDKLAEGVAAVRSQSPRVSLSARCTVQKENHRTLRATVAAAHDLGLDRISFLAADVSSQAFNRPRGWGQDKVGTVALSEEDLEPLAREIDALERECAEDFASEYIAETASKLRRRIVQYYRALSGQTDFHPVDCNAPWVSTVIETDGTVRPCFFQPPLGNIHQAESLDSILNSDQAIAWRQGLDLERDEICRRCVCSLQFRSSPSSQEA